MKHQTVKFILLLSLAAFTLFACGVAAPTPTATIDVSEVETIVASTLQAVTPQASPTISVPPTQPPALVTATTAPTNTSAPADSAVRIQFARGATSGVQEGQLQPGTSQSFLLGAAAGQPLMVSVNSLNNDVFFSVTGVKDGKILLPAGDKLASWQTMLNVTQDYRITVYPGASAGNFSLSVITPARITFDPGAVSAKLSGTTPGGSNVAYVLRASAKQTMKLDLSVPDKNAVLSIYGYQDGQPYLRYVMQQTSFELTLPSTQDYIIQVVPYEGEVTNYTLTVEVE